jgi:outer membrane protein
MNAKHLILALGASFSTQLLAFQTGVVDMQRIILTVEEGKIARNQLQKEIEQKEAAFKKQKEELDKMNEDWKKQSSLLSEEARMKKQGEFQEKFMKLRNEEMSLQQEIKGKEMEATQKIATKVTQIVQELGKQKSLDLVFESNTSGIMYAQNPINLTDEVISLYNKNDVTGKKISKK